jgi:hypothetical protein
MITISFSLDNIFLLVWQRTVYLSQTIDQNPVKSDIVPLNNESRDMFNVFLKDVANKIWVKLAKYATEDSSVIEPFVLNFDVTGNLEDYPNQLVYILDEPDKWITGRNSAMLTNAIQDTIISYVVWRWMLTKGLGQEQGTQAENASFIDNLAGVDWAFTYGSRPKTKYRTF